MADVIPLNKYPTGYFASREDLQNKDLWKGKHRPSNSLGFSRIGRIVAWRKNDGPIV